MDMQNLLVQVYNTLSTIDTHGENTMKMAACLDAIKQVLQMIPHDLLPEEPIPEEVKEKEGE